MKPWWASGYLWFVSIVCIATAFLAFIVAFPASEDRPLSDEWGIACLFLGVIWLLSKLKSVVFPRFTYAIGLGAKDYKMMEIARLVFVGGIVSSLVAGLVLTVVAKT